jgi:hypothetical protein
MFDLSCDQCKSLLDEWEGYGDEIRRRGREAGWRTNLPGGRDLCPDCRPSNLGRRDKAASDDCFSDESEALV